MFLTKIHNNTSSSEKVFWSESGEKSALIKQRLQDKTVQNGSKQICGWILMNRRCSCSLKEVLLLWTRILVKNILMLDLFHLLSSPDVNWWSGVVWIIVIFLSAVWTLILTAPIHCRGCNATFLQIWWRNKLFLISDGLRVKTFLCELFL